MQRSIATIVLGLLIVFGMVTLSGCATIINGTNEKVEITTEPSGATVTVGDKTAKTPTQFTLSRKKDHVAVISMDGYHSARVLIEKQLNAMVAGNVLIGGVIGVGIDAISGATNCLKPNKAHVILTPKSSPQEKVKTLTWYSNEQVKKKDKIDSKLGQLSPVEDPQFETQEPQAENVSLNQTAINE